MVKISQLVLPFFVLVGSASAFTAPTSSAFVRSISLNLSEEAVEAPVAPAEPEPEPPKAEPVSGGKIVAIKEDTVQFTAGIIGGIVGLFTGGPVAAAILSAATNYATKTDSEVSEIVSAVSKSAIEIYNYLVKVDSKYELLSNSKKSLESAIDKLKAEGNVDDATLKQVEDALSKTTSKLNEINEEYDLVGAGATAFGVVGDLVEKAVAKASDLNDEYKLTDKALESVKKAVDSTKQ